MTSLEQVRIKCSRKNKLSNDRLHFFSSRFSIYFSWVFINLGMSANQVTLFFFLVGACGAYLYASNEVVWIVLGYFFWRLHIIFDLCDGDVARFTQKFSINGAYWDYMIHSVLYPLYFISAVVSVRERFGVEWIIYFAVFGGVLVGQLLAVKNNYHRAMLVNGKELSQSVLREGNKRSVFKDFLLHFLSFEGFLAIHTLVTIFNYEFKVHVVVFSFYLLVFFGIASTKLILFSRNGESLKRA